MKSVRINTGGDRSFPLVAIGAAEGGKQAMEALLTNLPPATGMAYLYMQHAMAEDETNVKEAFTASTKMPVTTAAGGMAIEPNRVYIVPPLSSLTITDGLFSSNGNHGSLTTSLPVNRFFITLADSFTDIAIGIILSGTESDGAIGLKAIKTAGGITFVQDETARFQGMPRSAVAEGAADFTLSPARIAEELTRLSDQRKLYSEVIESLSEDSIATHDENLLTIFHLLYRSTGVDFSQYKITTIKRRIVRRMMLFRLPTLEAYAAFIRQHAQEVTLLYNDLLINVTAFFRDAEATEFLKTSVLPKLKKTGASKDAIRIWVPACSTGQEAYSLAILLMEVLGDHAATTPVQLFATDLSEGAINKARLGIYTREEVTDVGPSRLQRFFIKMDGHYRIIKSIRDLCIFATHNIAKDPPFSRLDLISCCNLLIYLDTPLQKRIMATFHYSLTNSGHLVLGKSETVGTSSYLFGQVEKKYKIYFKKKETTVKAVFDMNYRFPETDTAAKSNKGIAQKKLMADNDLEKLVDNLLLKRYTPASVLVTGDLDIVQFRGATGLYLEPMPGKASLNLLKMAKPGLGFELRNVVHKAKKTGEAAKKAGLEIMIEGKPHLISIEAMPMKTDFDDEYFLIVFETLVNAAEHTTVGLVRDRRIKQLEGELTGLREDMRSIVEAQEAANEELQSANEEIVSSNEELQSINEELETSKEEIESSNEELITINQELQMRNEQLAESQEYSEAVFTTIRESLLILDKDLRIKRGNAAFYKTFKLREEEAEGRLLYDLGISQWNLPKFREMLDHVLGDYTEYKDYEIQHFFPGIGPKVLLLNIRTVPQKIHGEQLVLLAIEDITQHREGERIVAEREAWFRSLTKNAPVMIWVADAAALCTFANQAYLDFRGELLNEAIGRPWYQHVHPDDEALCSETYATSFPLRKPFEVSYRLRNKEGRYRRVISKATPNIIEDGAFAGYIGSCTDIPEQGEG